MYRVKVENPCRCFLKSGYPQEQSFQSKEDAKREAERMLHDMNSNFCKKDEFKLSEFLGNYTITIVPRR